MFTKPEAILRPSLFVAKLCGVCPYNSSPALFKTQSVLLVTLMWIFYPNNTTIQLVYSSQNINFIVGICHVLLFALLQFTLISVPHWKHKQFESFFSYMASAQSTLFELNIRQPLSPSKTSQVCWILLFFIAPSIIIASDLISANYYNLIVTYTTYPVIAGFYIKVRAMMSLVLDKLNHLNWHLDDLNNRWPLFLPRPPDVTFSELSSVASWRRTKFVNYDRSVREITPLKIHKFNLAHLKLYCAYRSLNKILSLQLFVLTIFMGPYIMLVIYSLPRIRITYLLVIVVVNTVLVVASFGIILTYATIIKEKSRKTALLVHDLLDEVQTPEVTEELEIFSKSLLHRKVTLSAVGFFEMDLKIVSRMASILAPITLFLVQNNNRSPRPMRTKPAQA